MAKTKTELDAYSLKGFDGIGDTTIDQLGENGIRTMFDVVALSPTTISQFIKGDEDKAKKLFTLCKSFLMDGDLVWKNEMTASELLKKLEGLPTLKTDCTTIDYLLDGGIRPREITEIYGENGCIPLDEYVYTHNGVTQVKDVYEGMPMFDGYAKNLHDFDDDVYEVVVGKNKFIANGEHPIWMKKGTDYKNHSYNPFWMPIKEIYKHYQEKSSKTTRWFTFRYNAEHFNFPEISIGKTFARLLGYLMSDGTFSEKQSVKFTNINRQLISDVVNLSLGLSEEFNISTKTYTKGNGMDVLLTGKHGQSKSILKDRLRELGIIDRTTFGKLQLLPKDELIEFVQAYFNGDGTLIMGEKEPRIHFYIGIHERQAYELQFMLWRLGINGFIKYRNRRDDWQGCWEIEIGKRKELEKILKILDPIKYPKKFNLAQEWVNSLSKANDSQETVDGNWLPIYKITKLGRKTVRGWDVLPNHEIISYNGLKTHNSGKSQLGHALALLVQQPMDLGGLKNDNDTTDPITIVIDTEGKYSPRRLQQIAVARGLAENIEDTERFLNNIHIIRPKSVTEQLFMINRVREWLSSKLNIKLLIIDSATALIRAELTERNVSWLKKDVMNKMFLSLRGIAETFSIPVVLMNQIYNSPEIKFGDPDVAYGGNIFGHAIGTRLKLSRTGGHITVKGVKYLKHKAKIIKSPLRGEEEVQFYITDNGLVGIE